MKTHYRTEAEWMADFTRETASKNVLPPDRTSVERKVIASPQPKAKSTSPLHYTKPLPIRVKP